MLNGKALLSPLKLLCPLYHTSQWHLTVFGSTSPIPTNILEKESSCERSVCPDVLMSSRDEERADFRWNRFLHLNVLLSELFHELSRSLKFGECLCQWDERRVGVCGESIQSD